VFVAHDKLDALGRFDSSEIGCFELLLEAAQTGGLGASRVFKNCIGVAVRDPSADGASEKD
jgi:hypothetical protein